MSRLYRDSLALVPTHHVDSDIDALPALTTVSSSESPCPVLRSAQVSSLSVAGTAVVPTAAASWLQLERACGTRGGRHACVSVSARRLRHQILRLAVAAKPHRQRARRARAGRGGAPREVHTVDSWGRYRGNINTGHWHTVRGSDSGTEIVATTNIIIIDGAGTKLKQRRRSSVATSCPATGDVIFNDLRAYVAAHSAWGVATATGDGVPVRGGGRLGRVLHRVPVPGPRPQVPRRGRADDVDPRGGLA